MKSLKHSLFFPRNWNNKSYVSDEDLINKTGKNKIIKYKKEKYTKKTSVKYLDILIADLFFNFSVDRFFFPVIGFPLGIKFLNLSNFQSLKIRKRRTKNGKYIFFNYLLHKGFGGGIKAHGVFRRF